MIFYFSGTGNSRWVAKEIAAKTCDTACDISTLNNIINIENEKQIGFVFPIYAWGVAKPMLDFAKALPKTTAFTFGVCTCGAEAGLAMKYFSKVYSLQSAYSIVLPSNYIIMSNLESHDIIKNKIEKAKEEITKIATEISKKAPINRVHIGPLAFIKSNFATMGFNNFARSTKPFYANEKCNVCGLCAKECPAHTITIVAKKPSWGKNCYQCMKCLNICPTQAIQYGKGTINRGRYTIEKWLD